MQDVDGDFIVDMLLTCKYVTSMSKMIQIRNVPDEIHRKLKIRAVEEGITLSDLLGREARQLAERPTLGQMRARLLRRETGFEIKHRLLRYDGLPITPEWMVKQLES